MRKNKKGFTLVELVIVIAVIAILAAVLLPTFATVIENAKVSSATQKAQNALKDYFTRVATLSTTDQVDVIVTDSPIFLSTIYNGDVNIEPEFTQTVMKKFNEFNNINIFKCLIICLFMISSINKLP